MRKLEIDKVLTISTAHITETTAEMLKKESTENNMFLSVYDKADYGWFIFIGGEGINYEKMPDDLARCIKLAKFHECNWLCLDCDGMEVEFMETYEW